MPKKKETTEEMIRRIKSTTEKMVGDLDRREGALDRETEKLRRDVSQVFDTCPKCKGYVAKGNSCKKCR